MHFVIQWTLAGIIFGEQIEQGSGATEKAAAKAAWKAFKSRNPSIPFRALAIHRAGQLSLFAEDCPTMSISESRTRLRSKRAGNPGFAATAAPCQASNSTAQIVLNLEMNTSGHESSSRSEIAIVASPRRAFDSAISIATITGKLRSPAIR
jgi:hypothetical protein